VSLDNEVTRQQWIQAIADDHTSWVQVSDLRGFEGETVQRYGVKAVPQNFLIDPTGKTVASSLRGSMLLAVLANFIKL
jgi:hypothetical protein